MEKHMIIIVFILYLTFQQIKTQETYRLPDNVKPIEYNIELTPFFENALPPEKPFSFKGKISIILKSTVLVNRIVLNAKNLNITVNTLTKYGTLTATTAISVDVVETTEQCIFNYLLPLEPANTYILYIEYSGIISDDMNGFYRSSYLDTNGTEWMGATQLQPIYARRVFPCFDEPKFKAIFKLKIFRPDTFQPSISNTNIELSKKDPLTNVVEESFFQTPNMSTYLLGFVVSEFTGRLSNNFSIYARPDAYPLTEYSFTFGQESLTKLEQYMNQSYYTNQITKMDMVALPDFKANAMENWGILTYREAALLYDPQESNVLAEQRIATIIVHEQAHMWFGNLVTCDWWSYLWLNEGFARYFEYFGTAMIKPQWDLHLQYVVDQIHSVFAMDALETTHPMTHDVSTPSEIIQIFDDIAYNKGSAIIRMIEHLMGTEKFQNGLQTYLFNRQYQTATPNDLYQNLQAQILNNEYNVQQIMDTWTTQSGYPYLMVTLQNNTNTIYVSQQRFFIKNLTRTDNNARWTIPITYATTENDFQTTTANMIYKQTDPLSITITLTEPFDWIIFNKQQTGYYRVNYDAILWEKIKIILNSNQYTKIHVLNRAQIVDDVINFARAGIVKFELVFSILNYLERETHYVPWLAVLNNWNTLIKNVNSTELVQLKKYIIDLTKNIYNKLNFEESTMDTRLDKYNRMNLLSFICKYGHNECIDRSKQEFLKLKTNPDYKIPVNLRPTIYCTAVAEGNQDDWNFLWIKYKNETIANEQSVILKALGCTKDGNQTVHYLNKINSTDVRLHDKLLAVTSTFSEQDDNLQIVLDYILLNYDNILPSFGTSIISKILSGLAERFKNKNQIQQLKTFYTQKQNDFIGNNRISNAITDSEYFVDWTEKQLPIILNQINISNSSKQILAFNFLIIFFIIFNYLFI